VRRPKPVKIVGDWNVNERTQTKVCTTHEWPLRRRDDVEADDVGGREREGDAAMGDKSHQPSAITHLAPASQAHVPGGPGGADQDLEHRLLVCSAPWLAVWSVGAWLVAVS
jgi:hypothetical protein